MHSRFALAVALFIKFDICGDILETRIFEEIWLGI
jgi:hypothetical protein